MWWAWGTHSFITGGMRSQRTVSGVVMSWWSTDRGKPYRRSTLLELLEDRHDCTVAVTFLLYVGADANAVNWHGNTALNLGSEFENVEAMNAFPAAGADTDWKHNNMFRPDLQVSSLNETGDRVNVILKDPVLSKFVRLSPYEFTFQRALDRHRRLSGQYLFLFNPENLRSVVTQRKKVINQTVQTEKAPAARRPWRLVAVDRQPAKPAIDELRT